MRTLMQRKQRTAPSQREGGERSSQRAAPGRFATDTPCPPWERPEFLRTVLLPLACAGCALVGALVATPGLGLTARVLLALLVPVLALGAVLALGRAQARLLRGWEMLAWSRSASASPPPATPRADPFQRCATALDAMNQAWEAQCSRTAAELDSERLATADLQRQYALMHLLRDLAALPQDLDGAPAAMERALHLISEYLDWPIGRLVRFQQGEDPRSLWVAQDAPALRAFVAASEQAADEGAGQGLAGRALTSRLPHWVSDLARLTDWSRAAAAQAAALRTGVAVPVEGADGACWIFEFFSHHRIEPTVETLELVDAIRAQLSGVLDQIDGRPPAAPAGPAPVRSAPVREAV